MVEWQAGCGVYYQAQVVNTKSDFILFEFPTKAREFKNSWIDKKSSRIWREIDACQVLEGSQGLGRWMASFD